MGEIMRQIENFIKLHCDGSAERFVEILDFANKGYDLATISSLYNISPSNLSRRLNAFTRVTFKEEVWEYLKMYNDIEKKKLDRAERMISNGAKIIRFTN